MTTRAPARLRASQAGSRRLPRRRRIRLDAFETLALGLALVAVVLAAVFGTEAAGQRVVPRTILTYSQSTDPTSPFSSDQTRLFSKEKWVTFPFTTTTHPLRYPRRAISRSPSTTTTHPPTSSKVS